MDDRNPGFSQLRIICYQPLSSLCIVIVFKNFKDLIFVDDKLSAKTAKITSLENLYAYGIPLRN